MATFAATDKAQRQKIAAALCDLAIRVVDDELDLVILSKHREPRELHPPDCPNDGYRHYAEGDTETWTLTLTHKRK